MFKYLCVIYFQDRRVMTKCEYMPTIGEIWPELYRPQDRTPALDKFEEVVVYI